MKIRYGDLEDSSYLLSQQLMGRQPADFLLGQREEPRTHVLATTLTLNACLAHPGPADEVAERSRSLKRALRHIVQSRTWHLDRGLRECEKMVR